nr:hypothetical protein [Tanacetum cinerariifolium]GEY30959.1 hypothetical protein [Tanacetum cinerariifolium]
MRAWEVEKEIKEDRPRATIQEVSLRCSWHTYDTPSPEAPSRYEFENDGFIVNDLDDEEEDMLDIDDEKQTKRRKKRAEEPTMQAVADEAEPKKEVAPKPPPIKPKREELR